MEASPSDYSPLLAEQPAPYRTRPRELWSHEFLDALALAYYRAIAEKVRQNPSLRAVAKDNMDRWRARNQYTEGQLRALEEWEVLLPDHRFEELLEVMVDESENGIRRRQSAPFVGILTQEESQRVRAQLIREWESNL